MVELEQILKNPDAFEQLTRMPVEGMDKRVIRGISDYETYLLAYHFLDYAKKLNLKEGVGQSFVHAVKHVHEEKDFESVEQYKEAINFTLSSPCKILSRGKTMYMARMPDDKPIVALCHPIL